MRGDPRHTSHLAPSVSVHHSIAVVIKARAMISAEIDECDRFGHPLEDPIGFIPSPSDPDAIRALMKHIQMGAEIKPLVADRLRVGLPKDLEVRRPQSGAHKEVGVGAVVIGVPRFLASGEAPWAPERYARHLLHKVISRWIDHLKGSLFVRPHPLENYRAVVTLIHDPQLIRSIGVKREVAGIF